jgi:hypothetical protein
VNAVAQTAQSKRFRRAAPLVHVFLDSGHLLCPDNLASLGEKCDGSVLLYWLASSLLSPNIGHLGSEA